MTEKKLEGEKNENKVFKTSFYFEIICMPIPSYAQKRQMCKKSYAIFSNFSLANYYDHSKSLFQFHYFFLSKHFEFRKTLFFVSFKKIKIALYEIESLQKPILIADVQKKPTKAFLIFFLQMLIFLNSHSNVHFGGIFNLHVCIVII